MVRLSRWWHAPHGTRVSGRSLCPGGAASRGMRDAGMKDAGCGMQDAEWLLPATCLPSALLPPHWGRGAFCLLIQFTILLSSFKKSCNIYRDKNKTTDGWGMITVVWFCAHDSYSTTKILILCYTKGSFISLLLAAPLNPVLVKLSIRGSHRAIY